MEIRKTNMERRSVIEAYVKYDCLKKGLPTPDFATWDWSRADAIDEEMDRAKLKTGIPAGYLLWDEVELTMSDLRQCAIAAHIFPGKPRMLGLLESSRELVGWKPDPIRAWYENIIGGQTFNEMTPMLLRPAIRGESPAKWYIEDGSGRATAFVANQQIFANTPSRTLAIGYVGRQPDPGSSFMKAKFGELLH